MFNEFLATGNIRLNVFIMYEIKLRTLHPRPRMNPIFSNSILPCFSNNLTTSLVYFRKMNKVFALYVAEGDKNVWHGIARRYYIIAGEVINESTIVCNLVVGRIADKIPWTPFLTWLNLKFEPREDARITQASRKLWEIRSTVQPMLALWRDPGGILSHASGTKVPEDRVTAWISN